MTTPQQPEKYRPISFSQYVWERCKSQPLIPIGCLATVGALLGATVSLRTGNRKDFNKWLRFRVLAQGGTVIAMVLYGSVALTRDQQNAHYIKSQIMLGDLPPETDWPGRQPGEAAPRTPSQAGRAPVTFPKSSPSPLSSSSTSADGGLAEGTAVGAEPSAGKDAREGPGGAYPLPLKDRMKASEFAKRLKEAERLQKEEDSQKAKA